MFVRFTSSTALTTLRAVQREMSSSQARISSRYCPQVIDTFLRDGLQDLRDANHKPIILSLEEKIEIAAAILKSGFKDMEVGSCTKLASMADTPELVRHLPRSPTTYHVLIPNERGLRGLLGARQPHQRYAVGLVAAASESFCQANLHCSIETAIDRIEQLTRIIQQHNLLSDQGFYPLATRAFVSCSFADLEDRPTLKVATQVAARLLQHCDVVVASDTTGCANALQVSEFNHLTHQHYVALSSNNKNISYSELMSRIHYHIHGNKFDVVQAAIDEGNRAFDTGFAGVGRCPVAQKAQGNLGILPFLDHLKAKGYESGLNMDAILQANDLIMRILQRHNCLA